MARNDVRLNQLGCAAQDAADALARAKYSGPGLYKDALEELREVVAVAASALYEVSGKRLRLAFSPAKSILAVAEDNEVTLYGVPAPNGVPSPTFQNRWTLEPDCTDANVIVTRVSLSPDGDHIAIGLSNGIALRRHIEKAGQIGCNNAAGNAAIEGLALSRTGDLAAAGSNGIRVNGSLISRLDAAGLTFDPDGKRLAAGLRDGSVRTLDLNGNERHASLTFRERL